MTSTHQVVEWLKGHILTQFLDCWDFVRQLEASAYNVELPEILVDYDSDETKLGRLQKHLRAIMTHEERKNWRKVDAPRDGCLVEMSHNIAPHHIGVWIDLEGGSIAHYLPELGLQFQSILRAKAAGWRGLTFYEHI